jgi:hypothetical protein
MTVLHDDGAVFRHIKVAKPGTSNMHFNITTMPGYLVFTGDMGAFTFSRVRDMLAWHQIDWTGDVPSIDYGYWAEKCEAVYKHGGTTDFDERAWRSAAVREFREHEFPEGTRMEHWREFRNDVLDYCPDDQRSALEAVMGWAYRDDHHPDYVVHPFNTFYEFGPFKEPSFRFRWACWAIASTARDYFAGGDRFTRQAEHDREVLRGAE